MFLSFLSRTSFQNLGPRRENENSEQFEQFMLIIFSSLYLFK